MSSTSYTQALDAEWEVTVRSPRARRALMAWARHHPLLACRQDLADVLATRRDPTIANDVQLALAALAPTDELAARTLLQMLLPGLMSLARSLGHHDRDAGDEIISLAWERLRTYPPTRRGSVAGNVILDVRKRYLVLRQPTASRTLSDVAEPVDPGPTPEEHILNVWLLGELDTARRDGVISTEMLSTIIATRLAGVAVADVAAAQQVPRQMVHQRRWRAERRLRNLGLAG
jgi:DNA-directed RNA polymerase specialized sigma24 family protein